MRGPSRFGPCVGECLKNRFKQEVILKDEVLKSALEKISTHYTKKSVKREFNLNYKGNKRFVQSIFCGNGHMYYIASNTMKGLSKSIKTCPECRKLKDDILNKGT